MRNRRIPAVLLCIILLLGGCGSRRMDTNADGNGQSVSESAGGTKQGTQEAAEGNESAGDTIGETTDNATGDGIDDTMDNAAGNAMEDAIVIEIGPDKEIQQEEGSLICTLHSFRLYDSPEDASIHSDDMVLADAEYYMDRSKFLVMQADIENIDYPGNPDDGSINVSMFAIAPKGQEEYDEWYGSYPVYVSEAGRGETDYYHVFVNEGEKKTVTIGFYVPVKDVEELRSACRLRLYESYYYELPSEFSETK